MSHTRVSWYLNNFCPSRSLELKTSLPPPHRTPTTEASYPSRSCLPHKSALHQPPTRRSLNVPGNIRTNPPFSAGAEAVTIPTRLLVIAQDVTDEILHHLATDPHSNTSLACCSLVSKSWVTRSRQHPSHAIFLKLRSVQKWLEALPTGERSPAPHARRLVLSVGEAHAPHGFFRSISQPADVKGVTMMSSKKNPSRRGR